MRDLQGKNALLTEASSGLGIYMACELALQRTNLAITARPEGLPQLEKLAGELETFGVTVVPFGADLRTSEDRRCLVTSVEDELGPIDILVNNAGAEFVTAFSEYDELAMRQVIETNLIAPLDLARLVLPGMIEQRLGHIIQIASMAGKIPAPYHSIYAAAEAGLIAWAKSVSDELVSSGVGVSVVCPGYVAEAGEPTRSGKKPPWTAREVPPERVAQGVVAALQKDRLEVVVGPASIRPFLALYELFPGLPGWLNRQTGLNRFMLKKAVQAVRKAD